ncbi:T9SS type A sorting domain-containing protein [Bacteroidota bacterium]
MSHRVGAASVRIMHVLLALVLSTALSACLIIEVEITESTEVGGEVTIRLVTQENTADATAWKGVQVVMVPEDWTFESGEYSAIDMGGDVGAGALELAPSWGDSAVIALGDAPAGFKYVGLISDVGYAHLDTLIVESTVTFTAGQTAGEFAIGAVVTKESYFPSNGDWFGTNGGINGADSTFNHIVAVTGGVGGQAITLDMLNRIPQADLDSLADLGADMESAQFQYLVLPQDFLGETVSFTAVIASDPYTSGRATWVSAENRPGRIHIFVVDTTANSAGSDGMWMQVVDGDFLNTGSLDLVIGDVVDIVGTVANFNQTLQITPLSYQVVGTMSDFGLSESILDPIEVTSAEVNIAVEGGIQGAVKMWSKIGNAYIKISNATVQSRTIDNTGRPDFDVSTDGGVTVVDMSDSSLRYRNDQGIYSDDYNKRDRNDPFVPPPPGSVVNLSGYAVAQGDDPYGRSVPRFSIINIMPWEDSDLEVLESPPQPSAIVGPSEVPGAGAVAISIDVVADPARTITGVVLKWAVAPVDSAAGMVDMTNTAGDTWAGEIPEVEDGTIVRYWAVATDNTGASSDSNVGEYRALVDGVNEIADIQFTFSGGPDDSPLAGFTTPMNISGTVSSNPSVSGILAIQDDASNAPWSGIVVDYDEAAAALGLAQGDSIHVTAGTVKEIRGDIRFDRDGELTGIVAATIEKISSASGKSAFTGYKDVDAAFLLSEDAQEAHESMMLNFPSVTVTNNLNGFGEWLFAFDGDSVDVVADDASSSIDNPDSEPLFESGEGLSFLRGLWSESFGTYRLLPESAEDIGERTPSANEVVDLEIPDAYTLDQNYPNPFNPSTSINYALKSASHVKLQVFDVTGRLIETLVDDQLSAGSYRVSFEAGNLSSGVYLYRMQAGETVITNRMLLLK